MTESMARPIVAAQRAIFIFSCMMELVPEKLMCVYVLYVGPVFSYILLCIYMRRALAATETFDSFNFGKVIEWT